MDKRFIPRVEFLWAERLRCQNLGALPPPEQYTALNEILWKAHEYVRRRTKTAKAANVTTAHRLNVLQSLTRLLARPGFLQRRKWNRIATTHSQWLPRLQPDHRDACLRTIRDRYDRELQKITRCFATTQKEEVFGFSDPLPPTPKHGGHLRSMKKQLPSTKRKLTALYDPATPHANPTSDPERMLEIISASLRTKWALPPNGKTPAEIAAYLGEPLFPLADTAPPTLGEVQDAIINANESSPGPDGIPNLAYQRAFETATPVMHGLLKWMGGGHPAPPDFNAALLYPIPKDDSMRDEATRPIGVKGSGPRIMAKVSVTKVISLLQERLHEAQRGCVPGRSHHASLRELSDRFQQALLDGDDHYILSIDFKAAFDSVDHHFLRAVLVYHGFPTWFVNIAQELLRNATATPVVGGRRGIDPLAILRGVIQGCAVSVVLFLLVMNVFITRIMDPAQATPALGLQAYMDDVAADTPTKEEFLPLMRAADEFCLFSAMTVHLKRGQP